MLNLTGNRCGLPHWSGWKTEPVYEKELCMWINDGLLIPYPHRKLGSPRCWKWITENWTGMDLMYPSWIWDGPTCKSGSLWLFQMVMFAGKRYCLTRLGFLWGTRNFAMEMRNCDSIIAWCFNKVCNFFPLCGKLMGQLPTCIQQSQSPRVGMTDTLLVHMVDEIGVCREEKWTSGLMSAVCSQ